MAEERETLELDVVFVGAGPASLAGAYHLGKLIERHNAGGGTPLEPSIAVLEKGKEVSSHALSGAVVDPRAFRELMPDDWQQAPFEAPVADEKFLWLTAGRALSLKPLPPPLRNRGKYVASLGKLTSWLAEKVEELGIDVFCEFPAVQALVEEVDGKPRVVGVRTGDRGRDREGKPKPSFEPGVDVKSRVVVLGEGPRGTLAKQLEKRFDLAAGRNAMTYAIGLKEIWELPAGRLAPGDVVHTAGWPLGLSTFGGGFVYGMQDDLAIVGLVVGLDYRNPLLDPHTEFQRFKTHPRFASLLDGGTMRFYGAKAIPEGGWWAMPRPYGDGFLICGDSGGFLNSQKLKGIHLAMKSGMLAAETIFEGLLEDRLDETRLARYQQKVESSWIRDELYPVRNFHQAFDKGVPAGFFQAAVGLLTGGRGWGFRDRLPSHPGHRRMVRLDRPEGRGLEPPPPVPADGKLTFDKLADVYNSGTAHEEDQPVHLLVADPEHCVTVCAREYRNPCQRFCPAAVYEIVDDPSHASGKRLQINASNCVHCKTCDVMDPYQIITWVPPEGGGGPNYKKM
ncbi:MAG: electron transfer flavoprotein-ubiquinone oxidoreductase [Acidobacteria bacterium]|nr:MAG: electron transfer flavoprotein-ubiquinone oxidoreductase [Acidobacteriota bacterium]